VPLLHLEPGTVFAGDFLVLDLLSQGGMGAVYDVEQLSTGARRALKIMLPALVSDPRHRRRFEQEARVGALIESDHVVQVVAAGVDAPTGTPWLAMELLRGEDLGALMTRRGRLSRAEVMGILTQLCHALGAAHRAGVVHRDLKPENVFLGSARRADAASEVKVLDFGIARMVAEANTPGTLNVGSPLWMAPEQTSEAEWIGPAVDVWALGLLAFHLFTGAYFWHSGNGTSPLPVLLREIVLEEIPRASTRARDFGVDHLLPPRFDAWFARCVNRDPAARYPDASAAFAALEGALRVPDSFGLEFDDTTTVDRTDHMLTLSSIPPATPYDLFDGERVPIDSSEEPTEVRVDLAPAHRPVTRREHPSPDLWSPGGAASARVETGGGVSSSTPKIPGPQRSAGRVAAVLAAAGLLAGVALEPGSGASHPAPLLATAPGPASPPPALPMVSVSPASLKTSAGDLDREEGRTASLGPFRIGRSEVTVEAWRTCQSSGACPPDRAPDAKTSPGCAGANDDPAHHAKSCLTWYEAAAFCRWIGGNLPSEAQWESAVLGAFGLESALESSAEWTADPYAQISMDGLSPAEDSDRVVRGGGFGSSGEPQRARANPATRARNLGFRCVRGGG
jgi:serine/threonine protein kinase